MSGGINPTGFGLANLLVANSDQVSLRVTQLTEEASTGLIAQTYAGLGQGASIALDLQPQIAQDTALQTGITNAAGGLTVAQNALTQIGTITSGVISQLASLNGLDPTSVPSAAAAAQSALTQVAELLDEQYAGSYVFAGQDSANAPVPDPSAILTSSFYTQINAVVNNLPADGVATTESATLTIAASTAAGTSPFSATLEALAAGGDARATVQTGPGESVPGAPLANTNGDAAATYSGTTGSYIRDILSGLSTIASLTNTTLSATGGAQLVSDTQTLLTNALSTLGVDQGILGNRQTQLTATATDLGNTITALGNQVSDVTQADLAQTATNLSNANTQLQASYQLIANLQKLSLANYL